MGYFVLEIFNPWFLWSPVLSLNSSPIISAGVSNSLQKQEWPRGPQRAECCRVVGVADPETQ